MSSTWRPNCWATTNGEWTDDKVQETLAEKKTVQANFVKPVPVYIVYFSAAALVDGTIVNYDDLYKRDGRVITAMLDANGKAPPLAPAKGVTDKAAAAKKVATR